MGRSVTIIGAGQIGYAANFAFVDRGWQVTVSARTKPKWKRFGSKFRRHIVGSDAAPATDCIVDTIAFDAEDIERYDPDRIGHLIVISSASVYCDDQGRTLDEAAKTGFPEFEGPITETQSTIAAGPETYSTRKVRMEEKAVELFGDRVTILRPCAIYGPWSRHPREWWFVKRMLDGRSRIPLTNYGLSQFQTTDAEDIAYFAVDAAEQNLSGVFNVADEKCPTVREIGETIADCLNHQTEFILGDRHASVGRTPWSVTKPFAVSCYKMMATGCDLPSVYGSGIAPAVTWLCDQNPRDWKAAFPQLAAYPYDLFDYAAEDRYLAI